MSVCPQTGITLPECSCIQGLTAQVRQFQPALLQADPIGEIRVIRGKGAADGGMPGPRASA